MDSVKEVDMWWNTSNTIKIVLLVLWLIGKFRWEFDSFSNLKIFLMTHHDKNRVIVSTTNIDESIYLTTYLSIYLSIYLLIYLPIMILYNNTKSILLLPDGDSDFFDLCIWAFARRYISTISVCNLPKQPTSNTDISDKGKWLYIKKTNQKQKKRHKKQIIFCRTITDAD